MPNTCSTCIHWHRLNSPSARIEGPVGECRSGPPVADYRWNKTRDADYCSEHKQRPKLSLDAQPELGIGDAPPASAGAGVGKTSTAPAKARGPGNRPSRPTDGQATAEGVE